MPGRNLIGAQEAFVFFPLLVHGIPGTVHSPITASAPEGVWCCQLSAPGDAPQGLDLGASETYTVHLTPGMEQVVHYGVDIKDSNNTAAIPLKGIHRHVPGNEVASLDLLIPGI